MGGETLGDQDLRLPPCSSSPIGRRRLPQKQYSPGSNPGGSTNNVPLSQPVEEEDLKSFQSQFESEVGYQQRRVSAVWTASRFEPGDDSARMGVRLLSPPPLSSLVYWLGREDSNLRPADSKSVILPLNYFPTFWYWEKDLNLSDNGSQPHLLTRRIPAYSFVSGPRNWICTSISGSTTRYPICRYDGSNPTISYVRRPLEGLM